MKARVKLTILLGVVILGVLPEVAVSQGFENFLGRVNSLPDSLRPAVVDSFISATSAFPVVEQDTVVHFIYRGSASSVSVAGDANNWQPGALPMTNVSGTNFWYVNQIYPDDSRLEYKYVTNGTNWILDPLNPHQIVEGYGPNSDLMMPRYVPPPEVEYYPDIPHGTEVDTVLYSTQLSNSRRIAVYLPPSYSASQDSFPVAYFQDGSEAVSLEKVENIIDYLTAKDLIRPVIAVFVPYVNRTPEYAGSQVNLFMSFIVNGVVQYVDSAYRTIKSPNARAVLGASYGGNISLCLASTYPGIFGNVCAQSSYVDPAIATNFQNGSKLDLKIYMDLGTFDIPELIPMVRNFVSILGNRGYDYEYHQYNEGHSWGNWRAHLRNALTFFFPPTPTGMNELPSVPSRFLEARNFPNPFNPSTTITYSIPGPEIVKLKVYDVLGREVRTLVSARQMTGSHTARFDASHLAGGVYFYSIRAGNQSGSGKMILLK